MAGPGWPAALLFLVAVAISSVASMRLPRKKTYTGPENIPCGRNCQSYGKNTGLMSRCLRVECRKHAFRYFMRIGKRRMDGNTRFDTISSASPSSSSSSSSAFQGDATQSRPISFQFPEVVSSAKLQQPLQRQHQQKYDQEEKNVMAGYARQIEMDKRRTLLSLSEVEKELLREHNAFMGRLLKQRMRHRHNLVEEGSLRVKLNRLLLQSLCRGQGQGSSVTPALSRYPRIARIMCRSTQSSAGVLEPPRRLTSGSKVIVPNYANDDDDVSDNDIGTPL